jgi:hypothetical protein
VRMEWNKGLKRITLQQQREGVVSAHVDAIMHGRPLREGGGVGGGGGSLVRKKMRGSNLGRTWLVAQRAFTAVEVRGGSACASSSRSSSHLFHDANL